MAIENVQQLLVEQLGKNGDTVVFTTVAQTSKDWYCVYFPVERVVASITVADATGESALQTTLPAGTTGGKQATATCTIDGGGVVNTVTITYAGSGYTTSPIVTLTGGGFTNAATITASIKQTNYIYYGQ